MTPMAALQYAATLSRRLRRKRRAVIRVAAMAAILVAVS